MNFRDWDREDHVIQSNNLNKMRQDEASTLNKEDGDTQQRLEKALDIIVSAIEKRNHFSSTEPDQAKLDSVVANLDMLMVRIKDILEKSRDMDKNLKSSYHEAKK